MKTLVTDISSYTFICEREVNKYVKHPIARRILIKLLITAFTQGYTLAKERSVEIEIGE